MNTLRNVLSFIFRGPQYDFTVFIRYISSFLLGTKNQKLNLYTPEELQERLVRGQSIIRLGDGEAMLMTGRNIYYQKTSPALKDGLRLIINNYATSTYLLALPVEALISSDDTLRQKGRLRTWRLFRCFAEQRIDFSLRYADAHSFYRQDYLQIALPQILSGKHIFCVTKKVMHDVILRDYLKQHAVAITFIETPAENAYEHIGTLIEKITFEVSKTQATPLLLLSAGPASKALALHFIKRNIQCLDIGHGLEIVGRKIDYSNKI